MSRSGVQSFQSDRLAQVLAARRLSQVQLATMVGVSTATVSKWRSGAQAPEHDTLSRLATVVSVTPEWFTRPISKKLGSPLFRSNASAHVAAREMLSARLEWAQDVAISLGEFVDYPDVNLPERHYTVPEQITSEDIELAASECRRLWGLGTSVIQDLALAAEGAGVILVREETGAAQIEGFSGWSYEIDRPFILLSADKDNGYRSRFDLAHELGHAIFHRYIERPTDGERHKLIEQQAHRFAGALLLPAETFAREVRIPPTLDDLLILKSRWGVSGAAIIMRLHALELIDDDQKVSLFKRRSIRWGAKSEPGDSDRVPERPRLLKRTIDLIVEEKVMPLEMVPNHIGLSVTDLEMLASLPAGYFEGRNNVIEFARLKSSSPPPDTLWVGNSTVVPFSKRSRA